MMQSISIVCRLYWLRISFRGLSGPLFPVVFLEMFSHRSHVGCSLVGSVTLVRVTDLFVSRGFDSIYFNRLNFCILYVMADKLEAVPSRGVQSNIMRMLDVLFRDIDKIAAAKGVSYGKEQAYVSFTSVSGSVGNLAQSEITLNDVVLPSGSTGGLAPISEESEYVIKQRGFLPLSGKVTPMAANVEVSPVGYVPAVPSTYEFVSGGPASAEVNTDYVSTSTFKTSVLGNCGYEKVLFHLSTEGPAGSKLTFKATDSLGTPREFVNEGYWGPEDGFALPAEYDASTEWTMNADTVGVYAVTTNLVDLETGKVVSTITTQTEITAAVAKAAKKSASKKSAAVVSDVVSEAEVASEVKGVE